MEILIRLFVWILNRSYGRQRSPSLYGSNPMDEKVLIEYQESRELEREAQRQNRVVENFKSTAVPAQGTIDYEDISWGQFTSAAETSARFTFYCGRNIAKVIEKSQFTNPQELATFRRVIRRNVADSKLLAHY